MANQSIYDAFNRMWLHTLAKIGKCMQNEDPVGTGNLTIDGVKMGDALMKYDSQKEALVISFEEAGE